MRTTRVPIHLAGTVTLKSGDWRTGDLVFDLDEEWSWEMLDGSSGEIDYTIPFALVASIEPAGRDREPHPVASTGFHSSSRTVTTSTTTTPVSW